MTAISLDGMQSPFPISEAPKAATADEQQLVAEVLAKDRKATADFVARCADWLYSFIRHRLAPRTEMVEDLMQEALLAAWQVLAKLSRRCRPALLGPRNRAPQG